FHTEEIEDMQQRLTLALLRAGRYYKRQCYICACLDALDRHARGKLVKLVAAELRALWDNRKKHGAKRQSFGPVQEDLLERMVTNAVPEADRPKVRPLTLDRAFEVYCKSIVWNETHGMGRMISRELP